MPPRVALIPLSWLSAISHIALALLLLETRLQLSTLRESVAAAQAHRNLSEDSEHTLTRSDLSTVVDPMQAQLRALQQRDDVLDASIQALSKRQRRRLQGAEPEPEPEPEIGENVRIIKPTVLRLSLIHI